MTVASDARILIVTCLAMIIHGLSRDSALAI